MAEGEVMGVEVCNECHADQVTGMRMNSHGQAADARTPFAGDGCETCHGPGTTHFEVEGNCIISLRGKFGESVELRNDICLDCHSSDMMHWPGSTHESEDLACTSCHEIHTPGKVLERTTQAEVCYRCHKDITGTNLPVVHAPDPGWQGGLQRLPQSAWLRGACSTEANRASTKPVTAVTPRSAARSCGNISRSPRTAPCVTRRMAPATSRC